ncbi:hypothetical protein CL617_04420 [archaeon]|nr:hypothetical protein [archaeon]|tara:strand:- start:16569 stop:16910 length:342 start_codon:yes stop_codon:yes gene_type:complete
MRSNIKIKKDKYKSSRGSHSRILNISCRKCESFVLTYQKDGPGNLRRLYLDRIFSPKNLTDLGKKSIKEISLLKCKKCDETLGNAYIYEKENRKAFRLYQDSIIKKIRKLKEK